MFHCGMVPAINKPTCFTRYNASAIDHMFTNSIINTEAKSATIKADISDHFPRLFISKVSAVVNIKTEQYIFKHNICDQPINKFRQKFFDITWDYIEIFNNINRSFNRLLQIFFYYTMNAFQR